MLIVSEKITGVGSQVCGPLKSSDDEPSVVAGRIIVMEVVAGEADLIFLRNFNDATLPAANNDVDLLSSLLDVIDSGRTELIIEVP